MESIDQNIIRYIIPFSFQIDKKTSFRSIHHKIKEVPGNSKEPLWVEYCINNQECDLYETTQKSMQCSIYENQGIGQYYRINPACRQKHLSNLKVVKQDGLSVNISFGDLGLHIFRAGVGFFWYELKVDTSNMKDLLLINNYLKEIAHSNSRIRVFASEDINKKLSTTQLTIVDKPPAGEDSDSYIKITGKNTGYIKRSVIEAEIENNKEAILYFHDSDLWCKYTEESAFDFSLFIQEHLSPINHIKYFAGKERTRDEHISNIPDKAILFSVVIGDSTEKSDTLHDLYWLGKGYIDSYFVPDNFVEDYRSATFEPFQDVIWYASLEGCAQIINKSDNRERNIFFTTTYIKRLENYFYVYILMLHQYYGLLKFDDNISMLPNDILGYNNSKHRRKLYSCKQELSFFMMNSVFLRVSHITHQNLFFDYLKKSYEIENITELMMSKVNLMNDLVEQWQEKQKGSNLLVFSIIGGIFVLIQTYNNILGIYDCYGLEKWIGIGLYSAVTLGISVLLGLLIWILIKKLSKD